MLRWRCHEAYSSDCHLGYDSCCIRLCCSILFSQRRTDWACRVGQHCVGSPIDSPLRNCTCTPQEKGPLGFFWPTPGDAVARSLCVSHSSLPVEDRLLINSFQSSPVP